MVIDITRQILELKKQEEMEELSKEIASYVVTDDDLDRVVKLLAIAKSRDIHIPELSEEEIEVPEVSVEENCAFRNSIEPELGSYEDSNEAVEHSEDPDPFWFLTK